MNPPERIPPQLVIIADDLTGAADTAGAFASGGLAVALSLSGLPTPAVDVLSLSTDCRDAGPGDVAARVRSTIARARENGAPAGWYLKIDSALRGHTAVELSIMMDALDCETAVCAPALPAQGRVVRNGAVEISGHPLHRTTLGRGKSTSCIRTNLSGDLQRSMTLIELETVRSGSAALAHALAAAGPGVVVIDAETDADLVAIATQLVAQPALLPVGSAGLGSALSHAYDLSTAVPAPPPIRLSDAPVFCIVGSAHDISAAQVEHAASHGSALVRPSQVETRWEKSEIEILCDLVADQLQAGRDTVLTIAGSEPSPLDGQVLADQLAWAAAGPILDGLCGGLVLTGGDIAAAVCEQLDAEFLWIRGEVSSAIPWGSIGAGPMAGMPVVTKAGSFGDPEALMAAIDLIHHVLRKPNLAKAPK